MSDELIYNTHNDPFIPGQKLNLKKEWYRQAKPIFNHIQLIIPCRLHFTIFNPTIFAYNAPTAGGIGLTCSAYNWDITVSLQTNRSNLDSFPLLKHYATLIGSLFGYQLNNNVTVTISSEVPSHLGLGSHVALLTGFIYGLNVLFGSPLSIGELQQIISANFIETVDHKLIFGSDTGVGQAALLHGGLVYLDEYGRYVNNIVDNDMVALIGHVPLETLLEKTDDLHKGKNFDKGIVHKAENHMMEVLINTFEKYKKNLPSFLNSYIKPAFWFNQFDRFFRYGGKLNDISKYKWFEYMYNPTVMLSFKKMAQKIKNSYYGISSWGPTMFIVTKESNKDSLMHIKKSIKTDIPQFIGIKIAKVGEKITVVSLK